MTKGKLAARVIVIVSVILLLVGIVLMASASDTTEYSTDEYWVASNYHHVYSKFDGRIVNLIEDDEKCEIKGDKILVTKTDRTMWRWGLVLLLIGGSAVVLRIVIAVQDRV